MRFNLGVLLLIFSALFCGIVSGADITAQEIVCTPGEEREVDVWLTDADAGLAGYIMTPVFTGDAITSLRFIPSAEFMLSEVDEESQSVAALDLYDALHLGSDSYLLGTLFIATSQGGNSVISFDIAEMTDDMGEPVEVNQGGIHISVGEERPNMVIGLDTSL